jgi:hypothetical protein
MTNIKEVAQAVKDAVGTVYKDDWCKKAGWEIDKPTIVIALREAVNQLQYQSFHHTEEYYQLDARAILDVADELEVL